MKNTVDISDPELTEMDPVHKAWMFENWVADQLDQVELAKNHAYLLASFSHPEAVKQILGEGNVHESTEEEFEESSRMVREASLKALGLNKINNSVRKRKRRTVIKD